jgi:hypothetical protein
MSVSSEDVHSAATVNVGGVSITGCRLSTDHAELGALFHGRAESLGAHGVALLSLSHALVVSVEGGVSISDNETLLHGDGGGGGEAIFLFVTTFTVTLLLAR